MDDTKDIWCPDCEQNKITKQELAFRGKCLSCYRRETAAKRFDKEYVKFKDLPIEEQQEIIYRRATLKSNRKTNNSKTSSLSQIKNKEDEDNINITKKYSVKEVMDFVKTLNPEEKTSRELYEAAKNNFKGFDKPFVNFLCNMRDYNVQFRRMTSQEKYDVCKAGVDRYQESIKLEKSKKTRGSRASVYTEDVMEVLYTFSTKDMTLKEIYEILSNMFPNKGITYSNLSTKIHRLKLPHKVPSLEEKQSKMNDARNKKLAAENNTYNEDNKKDVETTEDVETINNTIENVQNNRFEYIQQEMQQILQKKYKQLDCQVDRNYTTQDYIDFLDMLEYLSTNYEYIIRARRDQHDIMNAYQSDVVHEMESVVTDPGDTYLQDKLHLLRKERRYYEHDGNDLVAMKPLFQMLDTSKITEIKNKLIEVKNQRNNPVFIPIVDTGMIKKYDWCSAGTASSAKLNKPILITNNKNNNSTNFLKINSRIGTYRVSCQLSGGGYGAFSHWHKDYKTTNEDLALSCAMKDLNKLSAEHAGVMWTDVDVHMLNV